jgi:hypothetical protein
MKKYQYKIYKLISIFQNLESSIYGRSMSSDKLDNFLLFFK